MDLLKKAQKNEITEHKIYLSLAKRTKDEENKKTLELLAKYELKHYNVLKKYTGKEESPKRIQVMFYTLLSIIFGVAFTIRLMEKGEQYAQKLYSQRKEKDFKILFEDEHKHEEKLISILKDQKVEYAGSIVLGLNDALVELTGALAGLSLALANGKVIAIVGGITGVAAAMSMAASSYLSSKEDNNKNASTGAIYTGVAYLVTVILLILPFILISNVLLAMSVMVTTTIIIIAFYTFYISTAKNIKFWSKFLEMTIISLTVATISFALGWLIKTYIGIDL